MAIFELLRPKNGPKNYFFKFSYTTLLNNHSKMVSIENQPIWTKIEDLHTFFGKIGTKNSLIFAFMKNRLKCVTKMTKIPEKTLE